MFKVLRDMAGLTSSVLDSQATEQKEEKMRLSRSEFLKLAGLGLAGATFLGAPVPAGAQTQDKVALGAWNQGVPWDLSKLDAYTSQVGEVPPQVVLWYQSWGPYTDGAFGPSLSEALYVRGHAQVLTWEPKDWRYGINQTNYSLRAIASGKHDDYIRDYAQRVKDWGRLLYIRLMHEMNGNWYPYGVNVNGNKPSQFKSAWTRVVNIFNGVGASNVEWVWCPNVGRPVWNAPYPMRSFYPGDDYVDWIGLDGYNYASSRSMPWFSFEDVFGASYKEITNLAPTKPLMLAETACDESGGEKAQWIEDIQSVLSLKFPKVKALIWFNQDEGPSRLTVDSSVDALDAFRSLATAPYLQGSLPR